MKQYTKTTDFTSAASSLMMIINHFNAEFELNQENEFRIWLSSVNLPTRASSIYGLVNFAKEQGLNPSIILDQQGYEYPDYRFKGYKKIEIEQAAFSDSLHKSKAKKNKIKISKIKINSDLVESLINDKKVLMIRLNAGVFRDTGSISNYLIIYGEKNGKFQIIDPKIGFLESSKEQIQESLDTLISKKKRHSRILVF
ncbi:MAG: peptidase C39 family protein [Nanoarchaeota archaeon]|nr:peptidase C39 family protein [Nanoarchaeota archaeon]